MATVSGVWKWVDYFSFEYMDIDESVNFSSNGKSFTKLLISMYDSGTPPITEIINIRYINDSETIKVYRNNSWQNEAYQTIDFGTTEQTVSDTFYSFLTANATQQVEPVPTPDWANCFVKTDSGNKAVEKVWIKQNGQLVTVWDGGGGGGAAVDFATDSWETISAACKDGSYKTVYSVGDTKDIELSTGETITVAIMGFDHDDLSDGSGKAPITVAMENLLSSTYRMNAKETNAGGWDECEMRTSTMATLLSQLPADLRNVIKQVNKKATAGSQSTTITTSADKLFLFALAELASKTGLENSTGTPIKNNAATYEQEGTQYEYFKNTVGDADLWKACPALVKKLSNGGGSARGWWLRSPYLGNSTSFWCVSSSGDVGYSASLSIGVSFGFCIG